MRSAASTQFVWFENFSAALPRPGYLARSGSRPSSRSLVAALGLGISLLLAVMADRVIRGATVYKTFLIWPYAVAPAVAAVLWVFLFSPARHRVTGCCAIGHRLQLCEQRQPGAAADRDRRGLEPVSYNFLFFLAGLQSIPKSLIEAAAIDGAGPWRRFWDISVPAAVADGLLPAGGQHHLRVLRHLRLVDAPTQGGPGKATEILVYKVYNDGFKAGSRRLLRAVGDPDGIVIVLTFVQFRFVERKVHY